MQLRQDISAISLRASLALAVLPAASLFASLVLGTLLKLGPLSQHMLDHIALIGVAAPLSAWTLRNLLPRVTGRMLATAAVVQIVLIWLWHLPPVFGAAVHGSTTLHVAMVASLYAAGLMFWCAIVGLAERRLWQAILALLVTGKLFCLFAAVLVFSPRLLYDVHAAHAHHAGHAAFSAIEDQHLAGLMMIAVCPLTYVAAGVAVAARWFASLEARYPDVARPAAVLKSPLLMTLLLVLLLPGCGTVQSTLIPASPEAGSALRLTWLLIIGCAAIFMLVMALTALAILGGDRIRAALGSTEAIALGGILFPTVVLSSLLVYGLWLASATAAPNDDEQEINVQGERWWWRVTYTDPVAAAFASANEIRIEVGRPVRLKLTSPDVIHSFWVPALAGKVDLIPGRTNELRFTATRAGTYRGQCAEYCGGPHAMMALRVVAMEPADYAAWLAAERRPAMAVSDDPRVARGQDVFRVNCIVCHAVRGTDSAGRLGPDLTHVASRGAIGGEVLAMSEQNIAYWLTDNDRLKPNNLMPEFRHLPAGDLEAVAAYIASLK
ncbi:cytochrome c oxidase assembly protein [Hyphomicrobium sp. CS1GBMeth3]|uniref:cytochrome c oxidase assembly protein n=1 Tax=Hyphomicrobium sp. CS1GBMeth3 TaxID=1892845 RepID=UPI0009F891C6|nr:cytochrome c oxidase assembly protein [Hyphomicrobium sp. CS1GBMeth3]